MYSVDYTTSKCLGKQMPISDDLALRPGILSADWSNHVTTLGLAVATMHLIAYATLVPL